MPEGVTSIGGVSFFGCPLSDFVICDSNCFFAVFADKLLVSKDQRVCYSCICELKTLVLPSIVEELSEDCFSWCRSLSLVRFDEPSSLKRIGKKTFYASGIEEVHIADSVEELCDECFYECQSLSRVTFGTSSSLKLIGMEAFFGSGLVEIHIPESAEELCERCFSSCESLSCVTFGESSSLKVVEEGAFSGSSPTLRAIHVPDRVRELRQNSGSLYGRDRARIGKPRSRRK